MMITWLPIALFALMADPVNTWKMVPPLFRIPDCQAVILTKAGAPAPGTKGFQALAQVDELEQPIKLPNAGPFDLYWQPKVGKPVRMVSNAQADAIPKGEVILLDRVGFVRIRGFDLPRPDRIVLAPVGDPGPGEARHVEIQFVLDYRNDLLAPEGEYSLWVVPKNGARAQRIASKIRILAGKITDFD